MTDESAAKPQEAAESEIMHLEKLCNMECSYGEAQTHGGGVQSRKTKKYMTKQKGEQKNIPQTVKSHGKQMRTEWKYAVP